MNAKRGTFDPTQDDLYEVTINPNDKCQFFHKYGNRLPLFYAKVQPLLIEALNKYNIKYKLYLDLSTPHINVTKEGKMPRLHFHGYIKFHEPVTKGLFFLYSIHKISRWALITYNNWRDDEHEQLWETYCNKCEDYIKPLCEYEKVPYKLTHKNTLIKRQDKGKENILDYFPK